MQTRTAAKLVAVAVGLRVLVVVSKALLDRLRGRDNKYDGLLSIVSYSPRLIAGMFLRYHGDHATREISDTVTNATSRAFTCCAAARAVETREQHSLIKDPLAEALAGPKAIERSLQRSQVRTRVRGEQGGPSASEPTSFPSTSAACYRSAKALGSGRLCLRLLAGQLAGRRVRRS